MAQGHRLRLAPGVYGLTMRDGRKIDADARGRIVVPDRYMADARDAMKDTQLLSDLDSTVRVRAEGKDCPGCGFSAYRWQHVCPRCGSDIPDEARGAA